MDPVRIEDLPPEVQVPMIVRELFEQAKVMRRHREEVSARFDRHAGHIDDLRLWRARVMGAIAIAGALGGILGAVVSALVSRI